MTSASNALSQEVTTQAPEAEVKAEACQSFSDAMEQTKWWIDEYGPETAVAALQADNTPSEIGLAQLLYIENQLHASNQLDRQKYLAIKLRFLELASDGLEHGSPMQLLMPNIQRELGGENLDSHAALICAFECPSADGQGISKEFSQCVLTE